MVIKTLPKDERRIFNILNTIMGNTFEQCSINKNSMKMILMNETIAFLPTIILAFLLTLFQSTMLEKIAQLIIIIVIIFIIIGLIIALIIYFILKLRSE